MGGRTVARRRNDEGEIERRCPRCTEFKVETEDEWNPHPNRPGQFNSPCRACHLGEMNDRHSKRLDRVITELAEGKK